MTDREQPGSFADHPMSITEVRADREEDCRVWTPRDALIAALRDLDSGVISPDSLLIAYRQPMEGNLHRTQFYMAVPDTLTGLGLCNRVAFLINSGMQR